MDKTIGIYRLNDAEFAALVHEQPFYKIACQFACNSRHVAARAKSLGLKSRFVSAQERPEEIELIRKYAALNWSVKKIADTIGRSQQFVDVRIRRVEYTKRDKNRMVIGTTATTTPKHAMEGVVFESLDIPPRDPEAVAEMRARRMQVNAVTGSTGSAAAMCAEL